MAVNFMGQTGAMGVLPYCYTELILNRLRAKDKTLQAFLESSTIASFLFFIVLGRNIAFLSPTT